MVHRSVWRWAAALALVGAAGCGPAGAEEARVLAGRVTHVSDGDTLWVRPDDGGAPRPVRLLGLDAPEICQRHGIAARDALRDRVQQRRVRVRLRGEDDYERLLGRVGVAGEPDIGAWLVREGHAWSARRGGRPVGYVREEQAARDARRGLWADAAPQEPRAFRRAHGRC